LIFIAYTGKPVVASNKGLSWTTHPAFAGCRSHPSRLSPNSSASTPARRGGESYSIGRWPSYCLTNLNFRGTYEKHQSAVTLSGAAFDSTKPSYGPSVSKPRSNRTFSRFTNCSLFKEGDTCGHPLTRVDTLGASVGLLAGVRNCIKLKVAVNACRFRLENFSVISPARAHFTRV
jgi:hypothetical protein